MKKEKSCGAIISRCTNDTEQILLIKHKNGGHWAFPKGHVEGNETELETAKREILEETGLTVSIKEDFRHVVTYSPQKDINKDVVYFAANVIDGIPTAQPEEVMEIAWLNAEDAIKAVTFENDKAVLRSYLHYLTR